ncbi:hypothetical protein CCACVL1_00002, partial [Corchorus capsularis]
KRRSDSEVRSTTSLHSKAQIVALSLLKSELLKEESSEIPTTF